MIVREPLRWAQEPAEGLRLLAPAVLLRVKTSVLHGPADLLWHQPLAHGRTAAGDLQNGAEHDPGIRTSGSTIWRIA